MVKAARRTARKGKGGPLLADRLLALFGFELGTLERSVEPLRAGDSEEVGRDATTGAKGRIEALSQMVRTLEKLLELKQLETLAVGHAEAGPDAEAERLAAELMRRLRVLNRRRHFDIGAVVPNAAGAALSGSAALGDSAAAMPAGAP